MPHAFSVITLFPALIEAFAEVGLARKAKAQKLIDIDTINPRDFTHDSRRTVDDLPYGGGPGMVMQVPPLRAAIAAARARYATPHVIYLSPQGRRLHQADLSSLLQHPQLVLVAGRYEGIDERLIEHDIDAEWSIGDYVLSGGELPAMVLLDALIRLIPGVMGAPESAEVESFSDGLLDFPHYTRPEIVDGQAVPSVLLSGNHAEIAAWRLREAVRRTHQRRPDLLADVAQRPEIAAILADILAENAQKPAPKG
jgi:tRNA (guanine37-N1)-methyltransferase